MQFVATFFMVGILCCGVVTINLILLCSIPKMRRIFSIIFAVVTIIGTLHFSLATHYCGGKVADIDFALGNAEASCGMENGAAPCEEKETFGKNCCDDHILSFSGTDNYTFSSANPVISHLQIFFFEIIVNNWDFSIPALSKISYYFHSPPANYSSTLSFLQVFRI